MSSLRTTLSALAILMASHAPASAQVFGDPLTFFATCTGRLSAQMEFQWLVGDPEADRTEARRAEVIDILASLTPPGQAKQVLAQRISAKYAQSQLLTRARFGSPGPEARSAEDLATRYVAECTALLLT